MPTAAGKSIVIAKIAETIPDRLLVLQPSKELLEQNLAKYIMLGGRASIYSASMNQKQISRVTYATIGSIKALGAKFQNLGFKKVIIDEIHAYPRSSDSMLGQFLKESGITHIMGLTATPLKLQSNMGMDGRPFSKLQMLTSNSKHGRLFNDIIHLTQIQELTEHGFWSPLVYDKVEFDSSMLRFNSSRSDYTEDSMAKAFKYNHTERKILQALDSMPTRRSVVVFMPSIEEAKRMATIIRSAAVVYSGMKPSERAAIIEGFRRGSVRVICNVNIIAIGFDHPGVDAIICARPTASLAWFYQAMGRGTRIMPGKENCLIIDLAGNIDKFGKLEHLYYKKEKVWKLFGEGGKLLTGIPLHEVGMYFDMAKKVNGELLMPYGKYKGLPVRRIPVSYMGYALEHFDYWPVMEIKNIFKETVARHEKRN